MPVRLTAGPTSSRVSRMAASPTASPRSTNPPGNTHSPFCGLDAALQQHDPAVGPADGAGGHLGVQVEDELAGGADEALRLALLQQPRLERPARSAGRSGSRPRSRGPSGGCE